MACLDGKKVSLRVSGTLPLSVKVTDHLYAKFKFPRSDPPSWNPVLFLIFQIALLPFLWADIYEHIHQFCSLEKKVVSLKPFCDEILCL